MAKKASKEMAVPAKPAATLVSVKLTHSPLYAKAIAFRDTAAQLVIGSKESHEGALRQVKDGKTIRKGSLDYYRPIKQQIDTIKRAVLDLEKDELGIVDAGLDPLERRVVEWVRAENARIEAAEAKIRAEATAAAEAKRAEDIKAQEDAAERLEAESPKLSAGELWFVTKVVEQEIDLASTATVDVTAMGVIVKAAGYADPRKTLDRFLKSPKILEAIANAREIKATLAQAAALREEPIAVVVDKVESQVAKVSGTRMTKNYSCGGVFDLAKLRAAYKAGELADEAFEPNLVFLNREAKSLTTKFEQTYPGARLKVEEGVAG